VHSPYQGDSNAVRFSSPQGHPSDRTKWLRDSEAAQPSLPDRLDAVFKAHVAECHPRPASHARRLPAA